MAPLALRLASKCFASEKSGARSISFARASASAYVRRSTRTKEGKISISLGLHSSLRPNLKVRAGEVSFSPNIKAAELSSESMRHVVSGR